MLTMLTREVVGTSSVAALSSDAAVAAAALPASGFSITLLSAGEVKYDLIKKKKLASWQL